MNDLNIPCLTFRPKAPIRGGYDMSAGQTLRAGIVMGLFCAFFLIVSWLPARAQSNEAAQFRAYVSSLWPEAQKRGITRATFDRAFQGVTLDENVISKTRKQPEFTRPIWDYLNSAVSRSRIETGKVKAKELEPLLTRIENQTGVDRYVVLAIWGMETNFGSFTGNTPVIRALASLSFAGYRGDFFKKELLTALEILQEGHVGLADFKGSWAGAMGQTQFMPSTFNRYALDYDRDGRRDLWSSLPDVMGSSARYLSSIGWKRNEDWGREVRLPAWFAWEQADLEIRKTAAA